MAFGKMESYGKDIIEYKENIDMILHDLKIMGYEDLTKDELIHILTGNFSIGRAIRASIRKQLDYSPEWMLVNKMKFLWEEIAYYG